MTTIAIIGGGIAGRSLFFTLAKQNQNTQFLLFESSEFAKPCSTNSTAIVAPRGVSLGHSALGNLLHEGFQVFARHVGSDHPDGVYPIVQYTGASEKVEAFKLRYPEGTMEKTFAHGTLPGKFFLAQENAFLIDPPVYLAWLTRGMEIRNELVTEVIDGDRVTLKTLNGKTFSADEVVFCGGVYNRFWKTLFPESALHQVKVVQGAYQELPLDLGRVSYSLTLNGKNVIYRSHSKKVLVGSTTEEQLHELPPSEELKGLRNFFQGLVKGTGVGETHVGLREKAPKRLPYVLKNGRFHALGGLYKNGFTLSLSLAQKVQSERR